MRVFALPGHGRTYSCVSYLVLGDWNRLEDVNTLVDTGADESVVAAVETMATGFGKRAVEQVVLTHHHFDHAGGAAAVKERWGARVLAAAPGPAVDEVVGDGRALRLGDREALVLRTPGHSHDSLCLFAPEEGALFSGDTSIRIAGAGATYSVDYARTIERLAGLAVRAIYPGHGDPVTEGARELLAATAEAVRRSVITLGREHVT